jgi:hypothetical protein
MVTRAERTGQETPPQRFAAAEVALLTVVGLALLHHTDHVLRADHSGWPFKDEFSPFTISLVLYPIVLIVFWQRSRPWLQVGLMAAVLLATQTAHVLVETPADQHGVWATNTSSVDDTLGDPNMLDIESEALGFVAAGVSLLLSVAMIVALLLLIQDARRQKGAHQ